MWNVWQILSGIQSQTIFFIFLSFDSLINMELNFVNLEKIAPLIVKVTVSQMIKNTVCLLTFSSDYYHEIT